ncbi:WD40 repeat-like protein [Ophiobolus disseminans]|uniref:WD40 repeat-like protein n=1 Tax=Ophiobolus disseminans TaxID=1469910 RepID=A0A6A7AI09_9PLEO|nr:WD40 repeat-like protein [Ophiobolus disseminans]
MSSSGLKVRCLASTTVSERIRQEQDLERENEPNDEEVDQRRGVERAERDGESITLVHGDSLRKDGRESQDNRAPSKSPSPSNSEQHFESSSSSDSETSNSAASLAGSSPKSSKSHTSCVQEAQLSPDGTCVFTSDYNRSFSVYPIDSTLHTEASARALKPYAHFTSSDPIWAFAANPLFNINDANSTHVLVSRRDKYITLHNALWDLSNPNSDQSSTPINTPVDIARPIAFYKLINPQNEALTVPLSLTYSYTGTHFFAGARNTIHIFDLTDPSGPIHTIPTIPSVRSKLKGGGRGFKGAISALTLSPPTPTSSNGLLAAGARTRHVGIYDPFNGTEITTFSLPGTLDGKRVYNANMQHVIGDGVSSLKYSPCGTYLYVAERTSDVLLIYDVRNFSLALGYCAGRQALTKQKLGFDVWNAGTSPYDIEGTAHELWAGGTDGMVRVWRDPYVKEGAVEADEVFRVGDGGAAVVGTMVHASGGLAVAACGRIGVGDDGVEGRRRGGGNLPRFKEWGSVDVLGLS